MFLFREVGRQEPASFRIQNEGRVAPYEHREFFGRRNPRHSNTHAIGQIPVDPSPIGNRGYGPRYDLSSDIVVNNAAQFEKIMARCGFSKSKIISKRLFCK